VIGIAAIWSGPGRAQALAGKKGRICFRIWFGARTYHNRFTPMQGKSALNVITAMPILLSIGS